MNKRTFISLFFICLGVLYAKGPTSTREMVQKDIQPDAISWLVEGEIQGYTLTLRGPDGFETYEYAANQQAIFEVTNNTGELRSDGLYTYEITMTPKLSAEQKQLMAELRDGRDEQAEKRHENGELPQSIEKVSGTFRILDGLMVVPADETVVEFYNSLDQVTAKGGDDVVLDDGRPDGVQPGDVKPPSGDGPTGPGPDNDQDDPTRDVVHADDVIITGSGCVGFDCVNGESFGFDTIRLKENNLRIHFQDTSNSASFPSNDWRIVANDTGNGGANYLAIEDSNTGRNPFKVEAGAPASSLYVDDGGRVGLGTANPVVELHVVNGDSPTLRLEQNGASGFTPQTWDIAGNETNFFVRDVTNGSKLPFRIVPNSPANSLYIAGSSGNIGLGTASPSAKLQIESGDLKVNSGKITVTGSTKDGSTDLLSMNDSDGANQFVCDSRGYVGIGNIDPVYPLQIRRKGGQGSLGVNIDNVGQLGQRCAMYYAIGDSTVDTTGHAFFTRNASGMNNYVLGISSTGNVGIDETNPQFDLHVVGTAGKTGGGSWSAVSDFRLKENIEDLDSKTALEKLEKLRGVTFQWRSPDQHGKRTEAGMIAQELERVFPEWVTEINPTGSDRGLVPEGEKIKAINFPHEFNAYIIEAIKELSRQRETLSVQMKEQAAIINVLTKQNTELEARLVSLEKSLEDKGGQPAVLADVR